MPGKLETNRASGSRVSGQVTKRSGPQKRAWDTKFLSGLGASTESTPIRFELTGGSIASGKIRRSTFTDGRLVYVSGDLTAPEPGRFFFQAQERNGVAGQFVGVVEFPASETAYRIEPSGPGKSPELVQRPLNEVLCVQMPRRLAKGTVQTGHKSRAQLGKLSDFSQGGIILLESLHGAAPVIYLDFAGGYTPTWGGINYARPNVSDEQIREVWARVAEDFLPFNINVTTDLEVYQRAQDAGRQRVIITPTDVAGPEEGGVAYIGSFNWSRETPCWVFIISGKDCAEACSHEAGHTLGLTHEGQIINSVDYVYYYGQGTGETGWAPIMGAGFYHNVSQWSKGEYLYANNPQDQLSIIAQANNGVTYRADDTGDTLATSRYLELFPDYSAGAQGVIERTADTDAFQFTTTGGLVSLRADPAAQGPDLAIQATLCDANEVVLAESNPQDTLSASLTTNLPAGTYTFKVTGAGRNDPLTNGFSSYASLGYYSITGSIANARLPARFRVAEHAPSGTFVGQVLPVVSNGDSLTYTLVQTNSQNTFSIDSAGALTVNDNTLLDYRTLAARNPFSIQLELFVDITDLQNDSLSETNRRVVVAVDPLPPLIVTQPQSVEAPAGETATLTVSATSPDTDWFHFLWFFNGLPLAGAYDPTLALTNVQSWNAGQYFAVVMDAYSSATSAVASITVDPTPPITVLLQPPAQAVFPGFQADFVCFATGSEPMSYQWRLNGVNLPGSTQAQLVLSNVTEAQAGRYSVLVTNSNGSAISSDATLELVPLAAWGWDSFGQTDLQTNSLNVVEVAAGAIHNVALKRDGTVIAWGATNLCSVPVGLSNVVAIAAAADHSLALKSDGTVTAWGSNSVGQLDLPSGATSIVAIAAGPNCSLALDASGKVLSCGSASFIPPGALLALTNIAAIAAGRSHYLALRADGSVIAWGDDSSGQTDLPTNLQDVVAIAAGDSHSLALRSDGTVVGWGSNEYSQTSAPFTLSNVVQISAGSFNSYALNTDGMLVAWGAGATSGVSLYPDCGQSIVPASVTNITQVSCGAAHTLALANVGAPFVTTPPMNQFASAGSRVFFRAQASGTFPISYQWQFMGTNLNGATSQLLELSNLSDANAGSYSVLVSNAFGVVSSLPAMLTVATAAFVERQPQDQSLCVGTSGSMEVAPGGLPPFTYQWLFNGVPVAGATNRILAFNHVGIAQAGPYSVIISNSASSINSLPANLNVSEISSWGVSDGFYDSANNYGQTSVPNGLTGIVQVAAGTFHSLALKSDGTVVAWGAGQGETLLRPSQDYGQCAVPRTLSNVVAISAGRYHSLALTQQGQVLAWGAGSNNQSGWPHFGQSVVPGNLNGAIAIAAGDYYSVALKQDGTVSIWGGSSQSEIPQPPVFNPVIAVAACDNNLVVLGTGGEIMEMSAGYPRIGTLNNAVAIAAGANFSMALTSDGKVFGWGSILPPQSLTNVVAIAAGDSQALAIKTDGTLVTWGQTNQNLAQIPLGLSNVVDIASSSYHSLAAVGNGAISIRTQPTDRTVSPNNPSVFTIQAIGAPPLRYQWRFNGQDLPQQTNSWLRLAGWGQLANPGRYQVVVTNDFGAVTSRLAKLSVLLPAGFALQTPEATPWTLSGAAPWFSQNTVTHGTAYAAQSGVIAQYENSTLQTAVTGPGTLSFWWQVSSKQGSDFLDFYIDNVKQLAISGQTSWQQPTFAIAPGSHSLTWSYEKKSAVPAGRDCGWLDQVAYVLPPPVITSQPMGQLINAGDPIYLSVTATGTPPLSFQWSKDGSNLAHKVSAQLLIERATRLDIGAYRVLVLNGTGGSTLSTAAHIDVHSPQRIAKASWLPDGSFQLVSSDGQGIPLQPDQQWRFQPQVSTNLVDWEPLPTPTELWFGALIFFDPDASNSPARFYRVVELYPP